MGQKEHAALHFTLLLLAPFVVVLILQLMLFIGFSDGSSFATLLMNALVNPLYFTLLIWIYVFSPDIELIKRQRFMTVGSRVSAVSTAVCVFLEYWSWGVSTGLFFNPDWESLLVILVVAAAATFHLFVGLSYIQAKARKEFGNYF
jgi:hypothetical protein